MIARDERRLALATGFEDALKAYMGTDSFPTEEWPALARAFADLVVSTEPVSFAFDRTDRVLTALYVLMDRLRGVAEL